MEIEIPEPCHEDWDAMERRGRGRYCGRCERTVVDFSRMSRREAERLLREAGPDVCGNVAFDQYDDPLFRPEPARAPFFAGGLVLLAALGAGGCAGEPESPIEPIAAEVGPPDEDAPCELAAAPMLPVDEAASPALGPAATRPVPAEVDAGEGSPTAEQAALTRRKEEGPRVRIPHHHRRGRIRIRRPPTPGVAGF